MVIVDTQVGGKEKGKRGKRETGRGEEDFGGSVF